MAKATNGQKISRYVERIGEFPNSVKSLLTWHRLHQEITSCPYHLARELIEHDVKMKTG
jgi:hypothetical protein